jgi:hypothetical protein
MKLLFQILFHFLTWFTNLNATPVFTKLALLSYELTFFKPENIKEESVIKIGVRNFARKGIEDKKQFAKTFNKEVWASVTAVHLPNKKYYNLHEISYTNFLDLQLPRLLLKTTEIL